MIKLIKWIVIIVILGGVAYYIANYDKNNPDDSDIIESTKEFSQDAVEALKDGVDKGKELINKN